MKERYSKEENMLNELIRLDNTFSESKFKTKVDNIFVMLHISLMTNNLDRVKHFISNKVFNNFNERLNNLNNNNQIQMFDELNVNSHRIEKTNILTFTKIRDFKIQDSVRKCPSCSANMNVNNTGKCEYCGTIYNNKDYDWILENIETK